MIGFKYFYVSCLICMSKSETFFEIKWAKPSQIDSFDNIQIKTRNEETYMCVFNENMKITNNSLHNRESPLLYLSKLFVQPICSFKIESYWLYEICHGKFFLQYHEEKKENKVYKQEYMLGIFPKNLIYESENGSIHVIRTQPEELKISTLLKLTPNDVDKSFNTLINFQIPKLIGIEKNDSEFPFFAQKINTQVITTAMNPESTSKTYLKVELVNGTFCAIKKGNRTTSVYYYCDPKGMNQIQHFSEVSICEYKLYVATPFLCDHPLFSYKSQTLPIYCFLDDGNVASNRPQLKKSSTNQTSSDTTSTTNVHKPKALRNWNRQEFFHFINSQISKIPLSKVKRAPKAVDSFNTRKEYQPPHSLHTTLKHSEPLKKIDPKGKKEISEANSKLDESFSDTRTKRSNVHDETNLGRKIVKTALGNLGLDMKLDLENLNIMDNLLSSKQEEFFKKLTTSKTRLVPSSKARDFVKGQYCLIGESLGWWKYEFCLWHKLTQYHEKEQQTQRTDKLSIEQKGLDKETGNNNPTTRVDEELNSISPATTVYPKIVLGRWDEVNHMAWLKKSLESKSPTQTSLLDDDPPQQHADIDRLNKDIPISPKTEVTYFYTNGDYCEEVRAHRNTTVRLRCVEKLGNPNYISTYLSETSICNYLFTVDSPLVCSLLQKIDGNGLLKKYRDEL